MIPLMKSALINERETLAKLSAWLLTGPKQLSMGEQCVEFERKFAEWQGRKYAVLFNSGSSANLALVQSLLNCKRLERGHIVGFSALTWATNVMPLMQLGLRTKPIDIDPTCLNITSERLRATEGMLHALFITNALGFMGDLDRIKARCDELDMLLIEDNCEALGSSISAGRAGNFGLAATFSFFVAHHMSTIEGGMCCTDDDDLAMMLRMVRSNGWDRNLTADQQAKLRARYAVFSELEAKYTFYVPAYNMRPTEITGFLGLEQLKHLNTNLGWRQQLFSELEKVANDNIDLMHLDHRHMTRLSPFGFPIVAITPALREKYIRRFAGAGVEIRPIIAGNLANQPFYADGKTSFVLSGADLVEKQGFYCGLYPELTRADMEVLKSCLTYQS